MPSDFDITNRMRQGIGIVVGAFSQTKESVRPNPLNSAIIEAERLIRAVIRDLENQIEIVVVNHQEKI